MDNMVEGTNLILTAAERSAIAASGDMLAATYDPGGVAADAFSMDNMVEGTNLILTAAERSAIAASLANVVEDTTPQLGGPLDVAGQKIVSAGGGNIDIEPNGTGNVLLGNLVFDADQTVGAGQDGFVLTYDDGTGLVVLGAAAGGGDMVLSGTQTVTGAKTFNVSTLVLAGSTSGTTVLNSGAIAGASVLTLPVATDTLVGKATTDVLTNKTVDADNNTLSNVGLAELDADVVDSLALIQGMVLDTPAVSVASDGVTITLSLEQSGGGDLRVFFSTGVYAFDSTPAATVALTAGTDSAPQINYIYILESTKALTASTSDFPAAEHAPVATVLCQTAASAQTDGAMKVHAWTDHAGGANEMGHVAHINYWIRSQAATWISGVALTPNITVNAGSEDNVDIDTTAGSLLQLHPHAYPAFDTAVASEVYVVNKSGAAYTKITDLNAADEDDAGTAVGQNDRINLVIWGVVSEDSADCKLMVNLPSAFHTSDANAIADAPGYSNYTIPTDFVGTGFLIARLTLHYTTAASGSWALVENKDLRGVNIAGGGSGGGGDVVKVGTPVNDQVGVWTGDGSIEGTTGFTYDGASATIRRSAASDTADGAKMILAQDDGAVMANTHVLGELILTGAEDGASTLGTGARLIATATEDWTGAANGAQLLLQTTALGAIAYQNALLFGSDQSATFYGTAKAAASTTAAASFNVPSGSAPSSPVEGDIWYDGTEVKFRASGSTRDIAPSTRPHIFEFALSDETSDLATGTSVVTWRAPMALTITDIRLSVGTAPTDATVVVDINEGGVSIFSVTPTIDATEKTSTTAATAYTLSDSSIADDAEITFDIDQIGSTIAGAGLKVKIYADESI
jgi:hypothetical protein